MVMEVNVGLTYPVRLLSVLSDIFPSYPLSGAMLDEEFDYMCREAVSMLRQMVDNCPDGDRWYWDNLCRGYATHEDIIRSMFKNKPEFISYLEGCNMLTHTG